MDDALRDALAPVLADIRATGAPEPRLDETYFDTHGPDATGVMLWGADGSGTGFLLSEQETAVTRAGVGDRGAVGARFELATVPAPSLDAPSATRRPRR